ncbi:MAG: hypothetical protein KDA92_22535, partial [Planctomycetales bacterium]|nr:hypothetical protein [Planctomycetales bacterium]
AESSPAADATSDAVATETPTADEPGTEADDPLADLPDAPGGNADNRPEFKPLGEVADSIRGQLATPIARQKMDAALDAVRGPMKAYFTTFIIWERSPEKDKPAKPEPPDLYALAADKGLTVGSIPLVNPLELHETDSVTGQPLYDISSAFDLVGGQQIIYFGQQIFDERLDRYQVRSILGAALDTEYLYWKTDEVAESVPTLEEARDEVVRAFKKQQAIELAKEEAKKGAESVRQSGQRPSDVYLNDSNRKVLKADSITWMTSGAAMGRPPQISQIPGIRYAGDSFMKSLFRLEQGEVGVAVDQPESTAYLLFVVSVDSDVKQLREQFYRAGPNTDTLALAMQENQTRLVDWYQSLEKSLGVKWQRAPRVDDGGR